MGLSCGRFPSQEIGLDYSAAFSKLRELPFDLLPFSGDLQPSPMYVRDVSNNAFQAGRQTTHRAGDSLVGPLVTVEPEVASGGGMSRRASQDASGPRRAARTAALEEKVEVRVGNGASNHVVSGRRAILLLNRPHRHVSSTRLRSLLTLRTVVTALRSSRPVFQKSVAVSVGVRRACIFAGDVTGSLHGNVNHSK